MNVSVVICTRNRPDTLGQALESVAECEYPSFDVHIMDQSTDDESQMEAWLTQEGSQTRLVVEERGLPVENLYLHGAGWQAHLEDLGRSLVDGTRVHAERWTEQSSAPAWRRRWEELSPAYQVMEID